MRRLFSHRPSAATILALIALFFAMSGTAIAATGGNFILGKSNTATSLTRLANTKGTALSLSSTSTKPPLTVSNSVRVPKLNATELDGKTSGAFMQGGGDTTGARLALTGRTSSLILATPGASLEGACDALGSNTGALMAIIAGPGTATGATMVWWNKDGVGVDIDLLHQSEQITPTTTAAYWVVVQVDNVTSVSTFTATEWYFPASDTCHFTAQAVTTNG